MGKSVLERGLKLTSVFDQNIKARNDGHDLIINQGGTRSGKTVAILQLLFLICTYSDRELIVSVVSRNLPHLKQGAMRDFEDFVLKPYGVNVDMCKHKTESYYRVGGSIIEFFGADDSNKVHGTRRDILFVNEANFIKYQIFDHLFIRTEMLTIIDYNPTQRFWVHDHIMPKFRHKLIKTTYRDNEALPEKIKERLEARRKDYELCKKKGTLTTAQKNWWLVYGLGEIGVLEGAIFQNWRIGPFNEEYGIQFGLDYGFHPDPDAFVKVSISERHRKIWAKELIYETNQGTEELLSGMVLHAKPHSRIIAESANPRTNKDLRKVFFNLKSVKKTKTVADWLRVMQDYEIIITEDSYNLDIELSNYVWSDKKAGVPIDGFNHLIDAVRYVFMMNSGRRRRIF